MADLVVRPAVSESDWQHVRAIRQLVFVEEQACAPEDEWDAYDVPEARGQTVHHLLGTVDGAPAAAARWRPLRQPEGSGVELATAKLERFAVLPAFRGHGFGRQMIQYAMAEAQSAGCRHLVLHAQAYLVKLYRQLGFEAVGEPFAEAGIEHVKMTWGAGSGR
ncbi:MAG: GNAT family N-acetyltransferase [Rubricoccaceae bacterium]